MLHFLQTLIDAASLGSLFALSALGIGLLFGILRLINFAHGEFVAIGAYALIVPSANAAAVMFIGEWQAAPLVIAVSTIVVVFALISDALVFRRLRRADASTLMIASFAVGYVIQHMLLMIYGARPKALGLWSDLTRVLDLWGLRVPLLQIVVILSTAILLSALVVFLRHTRFGIQMRAASEDFAMARYLGVKSNRVIGLAFGISGGLAAIVSLMLVAQTGVISPGMGVNVVLFAFVSTVVGGMGSLPGAVFGGLLVGMATSFLQAYLPADIRPFRDAFVFGFVILLLLVRPSGLIRVKALEQRI